MITAKIANVGGGLVDVGLRGAQLSLELENYDRALGKENNVGPPGFHGQGIFEDCGIFGGGCVGLKDLSDLFLERGY